MTMGRGISKMLPLLVLVGVLFGVTAYLTFRKGEAPAGAEQATGNRELAPQEGRGERKSEGGPADPAVNAGLDAEEKGDFSETLENARKSLPTISSVRAGNADELHGPPEGVLNAGAAIGELQEYLSRNPEHFSKASEFFADCASNAQVLPGIRALCLHSAKENPARWAPGVKERMEALPAPILDLESQL
jgi:hypothetical protein